MKIGLIGPYLYRGGIYIHIKRLKEALSARGDKVTIFDYNLENFGKIKIKFKRFNWLMQFFICDRVDIFHIHLLRWDHIALIILMARIRKIKTVVTFHSLRDDLEKMNFRQRISMLYILQNADYLISAGQKEKDKLAKKFSHADNIVVLSPFIPPGQVETDIPEYLTKFIKNHALIICANGSNTDFYQGYDLYGLDMLIELCSRLRTKINVGFIYCLAHITDKLNFEKMQARIQGLKIEKSFKIVIDMDLYPILNKSHIFIRPTCTDSYGISVAEALVLGIPSIASDVCKRPEGAILFHCRDSEDLYNKTCEAIRNYDYYKASLQNFEIENCVPAIINIYQELVGRS